MLPYDELSGSSKAKKGYWTQTSLELPASPLRNKIFFIQICFPILWKEEKQKKGQCKHSTQITPSLWEKFIYFCILPADQANLENRAGQGPVKSPGWQTATSKGRMGSFWDSCHFFLGKILDMGSSFLQLIPGPKTMHIVTNWHRDLEVIQIQDHFWPFHLLTGHSSNVKTNKQNLTATRSHYSCTSFIQWVQIIQGTDTIIPRDSAWTLLLLSLKVLCNPCS